MSWSNISKIISDCFRRSISHQKDVSPLGDVAVTINNFNIQGISSAFGGGKVSSDLVICFGGINRFIGTNNNFIITSRAGTAGYIKH